jgi:hypothetical protein
MRPVSGQSKAEPKPATAATTANPNAATEAARRGEHGISGHRLRVPQLGLRAWVRVSQATKRPLLPCGRRDSV